MPETGNRWGKAAIWMIVFGLIGLLAGALRLNLWSNLSAPTRTYYLLSTGVGFALLGCGLWVVARRRVTRVVALGGCSLALFLGVNQTLGLWIDSIPCFTSG